MNNDLEALKKVEKELGKKINQANFEQIMDVGKSAVCYSINEEKKIIGLNLAELGLENIPKAVFEMDNLIRLNLDNNNLSSLPKDIFKLSKLEQLNLADNNIKSIPIETLELELPIISNRGKWGESSIILGNNPIEFPPIEIIKQGNKAIDNYFKSIEKNNYRYLNEIKCVLIGNGASGKTSLRKRLMLEEFNQHESQTHGINIDQWELNLNNNQSGVINFWDFGGQEIMHSTHQFFLSKRSIYLLVLNAREEPDPEYWLQHIKVFSDSSPVIIVINKIDENPGFDINRKFLKNKYSNIVGVEKTSCLTEDGIETLRKLIINHFTLIPHLNSKWSIGWFNVKQELERSNRDFIEIDDFKIICEQNNIKDSFSQSSLIEFLNDLGVVVFFNDFRLKHTQVLQPHWLTTGVYKIINSGILAKNKGIIKFDDFHKILNQKDESGYLYPQSKHIFIFDLMCKFELSYEIKPNKILIPDLLQVQEPDFEIGDDENLSIYIKYDFLPKAIMPRFIVRTCENLKQEEIWRTGVILKDNSLNSRVFVRSDYERNRIELKIIGDHKRDLFSIIFNVFQQIHKSYQGLGADIRIVLDDSSNISISYEHLLFLEFSRIETYIPEGSKNKYNIQELLGTIQLHDKKEEEIIFLLEKILTHLDDKESMIEKANDIIQLQPNIAGIGININALVDKIFDRKNKATNKG